MKLFLSLLFLFSTSAWSTSDPPSLIKLDKILTSFGYSSNYANHQNDLYYQAVKRYLETSSFDIMAFTKPKTAEIKQLSFISMYCSQTKGPQEAFVHWSNSQFEQIYKDFFGLPPSPDLLTKFQINFPKKVPYKKTKLKKAFFKCDGKNGEGYRLDFFF